LYIFVARNKKILLEKHQEIFSIYSPVIIEVPHFASLRGKEREIVILRSDNGETWREHTLEASEEAVQDVLNESFEGEGVITYYNYAL
jgi:ankyrin